MDNKKEMYISVIIDTVTDNFVNNYDKVKIGMVYMNDYFKDLGIEFRYDYNSFCADFLNSLRLVLNTIDDGDILSDTVIHDLIYLVMDNMVKQKIDEYSDDIEKNFKSLEHELNKMFIKKK